MPQVINSTKDRKERIGKLFQMHANKENPVDEALVGHIYAVIGLKETTTGDTLCDPQRPIILESMTFPAPVIQVAIEPKTKSDQEKLGTAIQRLAEEDPTFQVNQDDETGQTIIAGHGRAAPRGAGQPDEVATSRSRPTSASRRSPTGRPSASTVEKYEYTHKKQTGGSGQFAKVIIELEPLQKNEEGALYEFDNKVTGGRIPREYIPSVDAGCPGRHAVRRAGRLPAGRCQGLTLLDGAYHEVDSSEMAFKIAGSMAFKEAARQGRTRRSSSR